MTQAVASSDATLASARHLADQLLFPGANATDSSGRVPKANLDALAAAGFYGLVGPTAIKGLDADPTMIGRVIEAFAGSCLTTTFIWTQHHVAVRLVGAASPEVASRWGPGLCSGAIRAGVAFAHLRRDGPSPVVATPGRDGSWTVRGTANWMTGWGAVDVINVAAVHGNRIVWFLCDAVEGPTLSVTPLTLAAVNASGTVTLRLDDHLVTPDRVIAAHDLETWRARDRLGLRQNGSFPIGLAARCISLLGDKVIGAALFEQLDAARADLDAPAGTNDPAILAAARARASLFAVRCATALVASQAGRSIVTDSHAQRLAREAMFLLVQGQTGPIRAAQLDLLLH